MTTPGDVEFMAKALRLAARGRFSTHPNPRVGCLLVRGDAVVGEGWHRRAGGPHAEVEALAAAGDRARGATAYVTLEPCSHQGRTPPCAPALAEAGVTRVVVPNLDPNPRVSGQGVAMLRAAGVNVDVGILASEARALNPGFFSRMETGRPRVTVKLAASVDGRTAMASGESRWITGAEARADVHRLRAESSAVVTGIGTILADDPSLTVRRPDLDLQGRQPLRVVLDSRLRLPPDAKMLSLPGETLVFTTLSHRDGAGPLVAAGARVETLATGPGGLDLAAVSRRLGELECNDLLLETGPRLAGAWVLAGLADRIVVYLAANLLGDQARPLMVLPGLESMADRVQLRFTGVRQIGRDLRIELEVGDG